MERAVPYHKFYQLGYGIDVTKDPEKLKGTSKRLIPEDTKEVSAKPYFTTAQFSFIESMKDVCDILGIPPEYALKVHARFVKNRVVTECLKSIPGENSVTVIFRVNFLQEKVYLPHEVNFGGSDKGPNHQNEGENEMGKVAEEEPGTDNGSATANLQAESTITHLVSAVEIGNELVVILKLYSPDRDDFKKFSSMLRDALPSSRGILDKDSLKNFTEFASKADKKLSKKHYQDTQCSIHYASFTEFETYPLELTGMVKTIENFLDKTDGWVELLRTSGVSCHVDKTDMILKEGVNTEKKGFIQAAKDFIAGDKEETSLKQVSSVGYHYDVQSGVDNDHDSFIVLASETDHMYYMRATLQSQAPDSELESFTSFALSQYPETSRERFEKMFHLLRQVDMAIDNLQDFFRSTRFTGVERMQEGKLILCSVQKVHFEISEAIRNLDMITMPSEEFVENLCSSSPLLTVTEYIENAMSKLTPGCDLDLLLIGKTGHGKSSTGNTILGQPKFVASACSESVTKSSCVAWSNIDGRIIKVVDTPGVCDTADENNSPDVAIHAISEAITQCPGGFHALLLVIRFGQRMTMEERKAIGMLKCILGDTVIQTHCVCVITHGDNFEVEMEGKKTFLEWCRGTSGFLKDIFEECQFRCVLFNNKAKDPKALKGQLVELVAMVDNMKSSGTRYTNSLFEFAQRQREKVIAEEQLPPISQEMMRDIELVLDHLKSVTKNIAERDKYAAELENVKGMVDNLSNRMAEVEGDQVKLLVETVFSLAAVIHGEIDKIADESPVSGAKGTSVHNFCEGQNCGESSLPIEMNSGIEVEAQKLQVIRDTQLADQAKEVDDKVADGVAEEIKKNDNCFPADSKVILRNGLIKRMEELEIGEEVLVRNGNGQLCFDTVFMFGHRDLDAMIEFIVLHVDGGCVVTLSDDHLVFCVRDGIEMCLPAREIRIQDGLMVVSCGSSLLDTKPVLEISREKKPGLFAPFTKCGTIVVDGAVMSCYIDVVPHAVAHALLSPMRYVYCVSPSLLAFMNGAKKNEPVPAWAKLALKFVG